MRVCYDRTHMKRKLLYLAILLGFVLLIGAAVKLLSNRTPKAGELRIESQPSATIFLDNKNIGKTPYKEKVASGEYSLRLVPESTTTQLTNWEGKIVVGPNLLTYVNASLSESELTTAVDVVWLEKITSKGSELSVTTNPDGATVLVDDVTRGVTPLSVTDILSGEHNLSITSAGFLPRSLKIKTTSGYRLIASLKLALSSANPAPAPEASPSVEPAVSGKPTPTKAATNSGSLVPDPPRPFVVIKDTPTGFLRVRTEPSTGASESARVNPGEKYTYFDSQNGWYQIKYDGKNSGWVSGQYVDKVE